MKLQSKTEKFIEKSKVKYPNRFGYERANYLGNEEKIDIYCIEHQIPFKVTPHQHLRKECTTGGCPLCSKMPSQYTDNETRKLIFLRKAKEKFGENRFDYGLVDYKNNETEVEIICKEHGPFKATPAVHLDKDKDSGGCALCGRLGSNMSKDKKTEYFIKESKLIFGDKFDYSLSRYINSESPITIICKEHGPFKTTKHNHHRNIDSGGCPECGIKEMVDKKRNKYASEFENKAREIHGNKYDYSLVDYIKNNEDVIIICKEHGPFKQKPAVHLHGSGCPYCHEKSQMETLTYESLKNSLEIIREFRKLDNEYLKNKPFDFYIPVLNLVIEINGSQHYETKFGYDEDYLIQRQEIDRLKKEKIVNLGFNYLAVNQKNKSVSLMNKVIKILESSTTIESLNSSIKNLKEVDRKRLDFVLASEV